MDIHPRISAALPINAQAIRNLQAETAQENAMQVESQENLAAYCEVNPLVQAQRFRPLHDLKGHLTHNLEESESTEEKKILQVDSPEDAAKRYEQRNDELDARTLIIVRNRLSAGRPTRDEIYDTVVRTYTDRSLADEALDFLIETTNPEYREEYLSAKQQLNDRYSLEIKAGRNMGSQARAFAKEGLGTPVSLRELYRDIINNPREAIVLFDQLADKFPYQKMTQVISFLLQSLGYDFRSKGPSISHTELKRLIDETRSLQGILGVYRFFESKMAFIKNQFARSGLTLPLKITFESLSRLLIKALAERYINPERIQVLGKLLGISEETMAQIIIYSLMREALRQITPRYFRNPRHKEELLKAFIDTLDQLDKDLEEEEEEEEKK